MIGMQYVNQVIIKPVLRGLILLEEHLSFEQSPNILKRKRIWYCVDQETFVCTSTYIRVLSCSLWSQSSCSKEFFCYFVIYKNWCMETDQLTSSLLSNDISYVGFQSKLLTVRNYRHSYVTILRDTLQNLNSKNSLNVRLKLGIGRALPSPIKSLNIDILNYVCTSWGVYSELDIHVIKWFFILKRVYLYYPWFHLHALVSFSGSRYIKEVETESDFY